jgi:hypothetical protein
MLSHLLDAGADALAAESQRGQEARFDWYIFAGTCVSGLHLSPIIY